jgi:hypothetical protein
VLFCGGFVSFAISVKTSTTPRTRLAGRAAADDAVGRRVGVRLVCATVGFMRFVRVVVPLLLFVPYKFWDGLFNHLVRLGDAA